MARNMRLGLRFEGPQEDHLYGQRRFDKALDACSEALQHALDDEDFVWDDGIDGKIDGHWVHKESGTKVFMVGD